MAKLTLTFKGRLIAIHHLDDQSMTIGREPDCRICIDSLAIAPRHAELLQTETDYLLLALDDGFPVLLNNKRVAQAGLHHGDMIQIGKHTIGFSDDAQELRLIAHAAEGEDTDDRNRVPASMQVESGPRMGKVIFFRRAITRLNRIGLSDVIVTRDGDNHFLVRLVHETHVIIDGEPIEGDESPLVNAASVQVGTIHLRFFAAEPPPPHPGGAQR